MERRRHTALLFVSLIVCPGYLATVYSKTFIAEKSDPPIITIENALLCLADSDDGNSSVLRYQVFIQDTTGHKSQYWLDKMNEITCGFLPSIAICNQLNISARSENQVGLSEPSFFLLDSTSSRNICKCFSDNVNVKINYHNITNPQRVFLMIDCQSQYINNNNELHLDIILKKKFSGDIANTTTVNCSREFHYYSLDDLTSYELLIYWISNNGTKCSIRNDANVFTTGQSPPPLSIAAVAGLIVGVLLGTLVIICCLACFILCVCYCVKSYRNYKRRSEYKYISY